MPLDTHVIRVGRCLRLTTLHQPGVAHGARHHRVAAPARSGRSGEVRLRALPPRDDERVRLRAGAGRLAMSAPRGVQAEGWKAERREGGKGSALSLSSRAFSADSRVDGGGLLDHPVDRESRGHAGEAGVAHSLAPGRVLQHADDRVGQRRVIARRHEQAVDAVLDDFGDAARARSRRSGARTPSRRAARCRVLRSPSSSRTGQSP